MKIVVFIKDFLLNKNSKGNDNSNNNSVNGNDIKFELKDSVKRCGLLDDMCSLNGFGVVFNYYV